MENFTSSPHSRPNRSYVFLFRLGRKITRCRRPFELLIMFLRNVAITVFVTWGVDNTGSRHCQWMQPPCVNEMRSRTSGKKTDYEIRREKVDVVTPPPWPLWPPATSSPLISLHLRQAALTLTCSPCNFPNWFPGRPTWKELPLCVGCHDAAPVS